MHHVPRSISELVVGEEHAAPVGAGLVGDRGNPQEPLKALVQVVAGLRAGGKQPRGGERAEHPPRAQAGLHGQPEKIEFRVVGDHLDRLDGAAQVAQVVAGRLEVYQPGGAVGNLEAEEPDVATPRVEPAFLAAAEGFDVQGHRSGGGDRGGDFGKILPAGGCGRWGR